MDVLKSLLIPSCTLTCSVWVLAGMDYDGGAAFGGAHLDKF